jgi:beta-lactamase class A
VRPYVYPAAGVNGRRRALLSRAGLVFAILLFLSGAAVFSSVAAGLLLSPPAGTLPASDVVSSSDATLAPVSTAIAEAVSATAAPAVPAVPPGPDSRLLAELQAVVADTRARVGVAVVDLRGPQPKRTELNAGASFGAASTYKFVALMASAERIAAGSMRSGDRICFRPGEGEDGWFKDYSPGRCFTRQALAARAAQYSDNTAGHMLVDSLGGGRVLNAYARARGAVRSAFYYPNRTTARDLAALWTSEAQGQAGGQAAQQWLYPLLTRTAFEQGVPAGVPPSARVIHKVGWIDSTVNDAALVTAPGARYVLAVTTDGLGGDPGWALVARVSEVVWKYEAH